MGKEWKLISRRSATVGTAQAALNRLQTLMRLGYKLKMHSPRSFFATCASQLRFPREEREKLGHWAPVSVMPDIYDRAVCATELRIRLDVANRITNGRKPSAAFEVPTNNDAQATVPSQSEIPKPEDDSVASETSDGAVSSDSETDVFIGDLGE